MGDENSKLHVFLPRPKRLKVLYGWLSYSGTLICIEISDVASGIRHFFVHHSNSCCFSNFSYSFFLTFLPVSVFCLLIFVNYHNTLLIKFMFACLDRKVPRFFNHIIFYLEDNPVQFWEDPNLMPSRYSYRQCQKLGKAENAVSVCTLHPITKFLRFLRLFLRYFCAISTLDSV